MAKSKEELDALKERVKALRGELKELSDEELKTVAGGDDETDCKKLTCPKCGSTSITYRMEPERMILICRDCGYEWV